MAEYMFRKTDPFRHLLDTGSIESTADILQRVGADLSSKRSLESGLDWLRRGHLLLSPIELTLSSRGKSLYLSICNDIIQSTMQINLPRTIDQAREILDNAGSKLGDHPILLHWQLMLSTLSQTCDTTEEAHSSAIARMILSPELSEGTVTLIFSHLTKLMSKSCSRACEFVDEILFRHALPFKNITLISKLVFMRIWMSLNVEGNDSQYPELCHVANMAHESMQSSLPRVGVAACHAVCSCNLTWRIALLTYSVDLEGGRIFIF